MVGVGKITQETEFIVGNPQITFFKAVYRRHSHFAIQQKKQDANTSVTSTGNEVTYTIKNGNGHLLHRCWLEVELTSTDVNNNDLSAQYINWTNNTGHALIETCKLKIDNSEIDKHSGVWLDVYNELNDKDELEHMGLNKHSCKHSYLKSNRHSLKNINLIIPFKFWFNKNPGLALPLCSIDKADVDFVIKFKKLSTLVNISNNDVYDKTLNTIQDPVVTFYSEIIHLDADEQRRFTQNRHEYLIETIQEKEESFDTNVKINFSHPVKELIWVIRHSTRFAQDKDASIASNNIDATYNRSYNSKGTGGTVLFGVDPATAAANNNNNISYKDERITQGNDYFEYCCGALGGEDGNDSITPTGVTSRHGGNNLYGNNTEGCDWFDTFELKIAGETQFDSLNASYLRTSLPIQYGHKLPNKHIYCYSFSLNPDEYTPSGVKNLSNSSNQTLVFTTPIKSSTNVIITIFAVNYNIFRVFNGKAAIIFSQ